MFSDKKKVLLFLTIVTAVLLGYSYVFSQEPLITVNTQLMDFGGVVSGNTKTMTLEIFNVGGGTLTGIISSDQPWIIPSQCVFQGNNIIIHVTVDTIQINQGAGQYLGNITIDSNGSQYPVSISVITYLLIQTPKIHISSGNPQDYYYEGRSSVTLSFGDVSIGKTSQPRKLNIRNIGSGGPLTGTIYTEDKWIKLDETTFSLDCACLLELHVTIDNNALKQKTGKVTGRVIVNSNASNSQMDEIMVEFSATCVLARPNPVKLSGGSAAGLTFFGDGIVPDNTEICVYTLSGSLVRILSKTNDADEITWDGCGMNGQLINPGLYIYTYKSPRERGTGKFTCVR